MATIKTSIVCWISIFITLPVVLNLLARVPGCIVTARSLLVAPISGYFLNCKAFMGSSVTFYLNLFPIGLENLFQMLLKKFLIASPSSSNCYRVKVKPLFCFKMDKTIPKKNIRIRHVSIRCDIFIKTYMFAYVFGPLRKNEAPRLCKSSIGRNLCFALPIFTQKAF